MRLLVSFLLAGVMMLTPALAQADTAEEDANDVYDWTGSFDGGDGSTLNTSPDAEDGDADYSL